VENFLFLSFCVKVDESQISGDGFMLNLTFVLQQLALPIDVERVKKEIFF